jgi:uncharacterized membrane protein
MPPSTIAYWLCTGLFCLMFAFSGTGHLLRLEQFAEGIVSLGYPAYLLSILGAAKILGAAALIVPARPLLKEWAYAGFTFNLLGATASHIFAGDPVAETVRPAVVLCLGWASYLLRPAERRLDASPTFGAAASVQAT